MSADKIEEKWNEVFIQFLDQLILIFPDSQAKVWKKGFGLSKLFFGQRPIEIFIEGTEKHENEIMSKDSAYFFNNKVDFVEKLDLKYYYENSNEKNRGIIWDYINVLFILSKGYKEKA